MTYEMYRYVFIGAGAACGAMTLVSVILFFALNIRKVIDDLSGRAQKRGVQDIKRQSEQGSYVRSEQPPVRKKEAENRAGITGQLNADRGRKSSGTAARPAARKTQPAKHPPVTRPQEETTVLETAEETTVLEAAEETTVLQSGSEQTTLLDEGMAIASPPLTIEFEITYIHTNEVI